MMILAIDLGKFNSMACIYRTENPDHPAFRKVPSTPAAFHDLLAELAPARLAIEIGAMAGWVKDLGEAMGVPVEVANVNAEAWRWNVVKKKTDKTDALKLAQMSVLGKLPQVHVPALKVRQWRELIGFRQRLVAQRTGIKNHLRSLLLAQGRQLARGKAGFSQASLAALAREARELSRCAIEELWRGQLKMDLTALEQVETMVQAVEQRLDALAKEDRQVQLLMSIPGVGPRLAELVVAVLDDARRFKNRRQVGSYAGLTPRVYQSGQMERQGRISGRGNRLLRALLVEVGWLMRRWNEHFKGIFDRISRGNKKRKKIAVTAVARRLLVVCWAMLRDGKPWREPSPAAAAQAA